MPVKNAFLAGILATVPEADRGKAEAELIALEEGGLRQADYSKLSAEAQAAKQKFDDLYTKNTDWYTSRQRDLAELDTLRARVAADPEPGGVKPAVPTPELMTKQEVLALFDTTERGAVGFIAEANALTMKHYKEFGEILTITDLLADPRVQKIGLQGVYADKFKDQIKTKADAAQATRDEALRKEGADKLRAELIGKQHPYPVVGNEPSSLDAIEAATRAGETKITVKSLDDIAGEYARLSAIRSGVSSP